MIPRIEWLDLGHDYIKLKIDGFDMAMSCEHCGVVKKMKIGSISSLMLANEEECPIKVARYVHDS